MKKANKFKGLQKNIENAKNEIEKEKYKKQAMKEFNDLYQKYLEIKKKEAKHLNSEQLEFFLTLENKLNEIKNEIENV